MPSSDLFDSQLRRDIQKSLRSLAIGAMARANPSWVPADMCYMYFRPPSHILRTGCWCPHPTQPRVHNWTNCPNTGPIRPSIISSSAVAQPWGRYDFPTHAEADTFRFFPSEAIYNFLQWEFRRPAPPNPVYTLTRNEESQIRNWTADLHRIMSEQRRQPSLDSHYFAVYRIVADLRRPTLSEAASRSPHAADIERVHIMLSWQNKSVQDILNILGESMRYYRMDADDFLGSD